MALFSAADIVAAIFLLVAVTDAVMRHDERKSSRAILAAMIASIVFMLLDSCSGFVYPASTPDAVLRAMAAVSAVATKCIMLFHCFYCYQYFRERVSIGRRWFAVPMALLAAVVIAQVCVVFSDGYVTVSGGAVTKVGDVPAVINLVSVVLACYFPVLAITRRKDVGSDAVFLVGAFNIFLIALPLAGLHDYTTCYSGCMMFITYALLQNGIYNRREQERQDLEANREELEALNGQLEEHQAQLEEAAAEQEAQIEEIHALNGELAGQKENLEKHYDAVRSLAKVYYAAYYVDVDHDDFYEILSDDDVRSKYAKFGPKGKAQAALSWAVEHNIAPGYREAARAFTDYSTLSGRMRDTDILALRVQTVSGSWSRLRFIAGTRHEDGTLKSCTFAARNVNDEVAEEQQRSAELQNALKLAQDSAAEQEAQLEEITALNGQLESNQAELEASMAEQEAQLEEIQKLNEEVQDRLGIIQSAMKVYFAAIYIDLKKDSYITLKRVRNMEQRGFTPQGRAQETLYSLSAPAVCLPEFAAAMHSFMDLSTLDERLKDTDAVTMQYKGVLNGWQQIFFIAGDRDEDGKLKTAMLVSRAIREEKEKELAQLHAIEEERAKVSEAYGMIEGLSSEYHTIWVVSKETSRMRLIRSTGKTTIRNAVQMGIDLPEFDSGFEKYIETYVEPGDRERMHREIAFAEVLRHLGEHPDQIYAVNYLRRDDSGNVGYHQIAFANADTEDGVKATPYKYHFSCEEAPANETGSHQ